MQAFGCACWSLMVDLHITGRLLTHKEKKPKPVELCSYIATHVCSNELMRSMVYQSQAGSCSYMFCHTGACALFQSQCIRHIMHTRTAGRSSLPSCGSKKSCEPAADTESQFTAALQSTCTHVYTHLYSEHVDQIPILQCRSPMQVT